MSISTAGTRELLGGIEGRNPFVAVTFGVEALGGMCEKLVVGVPPGCDETDRFGPGIVEAIAAIMLYEY